jgi:hypothetical protein
MKLFVMQFSPFSCHLISLRSKYPTQHPVLRHSLSLCTSFNIREQVSHPYKTTGKTKVFYVIIFKFLRQQKRRRKVLDRMVASVTRIQSHILTVTRFLTNCLLFLCPDFDLHSSNNTAYAWVSSRFFVDQLMPSPMYQNIGNLFVGFCT